MPTSVGATIQALACRVAVRAVAGHAALVTCRALGRRPEQAEEGDGDQDDQDRGGRGAAAPMPPATICELAAEQAERRHRAQREDASQEDRAGPRQPLQRATDRGELLGLKAADDDTRAHEGVALGRRVGQDVEEDAQQRRAAYRSETPMATMPMCSTLE
ncbi:MAG: hypothetical protein QM747_20360 [Nocardioides sp.]